MYQAFAREHLAKLARESEESSLNVVEGEFPEGVYDATLTFSLPGVGEIAATLPISVRSRNSLTP